MEVALPMMKKCRFYLFILIIAYLPALNSGFNSNPNNLPSGVNSNWNSIFQFQGNEGNGALSLGTATIVGDSDDKIYLLTANHVVNSTCRRIGPCTNRTQIFQQNTELNKSVRIPTVQLEKVDRGNDLAVISVSKKLFQQQIPRLKVASTPRQCGGQLRENVYTVGYPALHLRYGGSSQLPYKKVWSGGQVRRLREQTSVQGLGSFNMTNISNEVLPGNSGGPTFNSQGEIVGVVSNGDLDSGPNKKNYTTMISTCEATKKIVSSLPQARVDIASNPPRETMPPVLDLENGEFVNQ